ncbi:SMI1/KNR4 family protein [Kitasatospora sp. NPDC059462]|uniref:SMI1/KNR4 family protein n=2 Tax=unclassified Kitasatospora TaxID=2633591 RepID=UPI0036C86A5F
MLALHAFATWEPLLTLLRAGRPAARTGAMTGSVAVASWSLPLDRESGDRAAAPVQRALVEAGVREVVFAAETAPDGGTVLHVCETGPAVELPPGPRSPGRGTLVLVDGAVAEPWRRRPEPVPGAVSAASADPELLERTLRERLPDAVGVTEEEIAATEERLGVALPEELKALYRVTRVFPPGPDGSGDWEADFAEQQAAESAVGCELSSLEHLFTFGPTFRRGEWWHAATTAVATPPGAAVQGLVGSPGWIAFGSNGGDTFAVDLTPGPGGHLGQVVLIGHEESIGAELYGESLTGLVLNRFERGVREAGPPEPRPAEVTAEVTAVTGGGHGPDALGSAAHPELEVVRIRGGGRPGGTPLGLAPIAGLPRVRTLVAGPGTLADPLEVAGLPGLEYLALGPDEWRVLLDAGAVPPGLSAAAVEVRGDERPSELVAVANAVLALWDRPLITRTTVEGRLGPSAAEGRSLSGGDGDDGGGGGGGR